MARSNTGQTYRSPPPVPSGDVGGVVVVQTDSPDIVNFDPGSNTTQIELPDGSVSISLGPPKPDLKKDEDFYDNIAEHIDDANLSIIAERLLAGIESDIQSRASWLENVTSGISLLGLEMKKTRGASISGSTPSEGISDVDHPLLLEAVLRFQSNARGELLPTDGPVKVSNSGQETQLTTKLAEALEKDLNTYLTKTAPEYYPDTDRMLLLLGFSGISFKKGYHHPLKRRPVIESIGAKDLIVSNAATDIEGAGRVTHRVMMRPSDLKRMQLVGAYRDVDLPPMNYPAEKNPVDTKIDQIQGIAPPTSMDSMDHDRELYETYCEIEIPGYEHEFDGKKTGLPLPYKVTIDRDTRKVLEIRRNWEEDDELCMARNRIIAYIFIPGMGFYGIGLVNVLGNATRAVTAAWRLMLDAGMFANFPGFLYVKSLSRQLTNQFRVPPGGGMPIDTAGGDIRTAVMPLPYKDPSAVFIQLIDNIAQTAQRVGGTAELQIGEGKQDAPVGTTLAMIEQATKLISAVHKRLHQAQGQEFEMLRSLLMEDPEALWRHNKKKSEVLKVLVEHHGLSSIDELLEQSEERHIQMILAALDCCELSPRADPNTSSQTERYLKVVAMRQMAATNPSLDINAIDHFALQVMGIDDPDQYFKPQQSSVGAPPPDPRMISAQADVMDAHTKQQDAQIRAQQSQAQMQLNAAELQNKTQETAAREKIAALGVARAMVVHRDEQGLAEKQFVSDHMNKVADRQAGLVQQKQDHQHEAGQQLQDQSHQVGLANLNNTANNQQAQGVAQHSAISDLISKQHDLLADAQQQEHERGLAAAEMQHAANIASNEQNHQKSEAALDRYHQATTAQMRAAAGPRSAKRGK